METTEILMSVEEFIKTVKCTFCEMVTFCDEFDADIKEHEENNYFPMEYIQYMDDQLKEVEKDFEVLSEGLIKDYPPYIWIKLSKDKMNVISKLTYSRSKISRLKLKALIGGVGL